MPVNSLKKPVIEVISSTELNKSQKEKIMNKGLLVFNLKIADFIFNIDERLIAGLQLKYGSRVLDLNIKEKVVKI